MEQEQPKPLRYHNFILSLWQGNPTLLATPGWRYRLENPHTGERMGFNSIEALVRFLQDWTVVNQDKTE